jgi:AraC-like DNA-binding protein
MNDLDHHVRRASVEETLGTPRRVDHGRARRIDLPNAPKLRGRAGVAYPPNQSKMARPSKEPPSLSSLVPAIVRHARGRGLDLEGLGWRFGLPPDAADREDLLAPADTANELLQLVARNTGEDDVALRVASELTANRLRLVELVVRASATLRDALGSLARWAPLIHDGFEGSLKEEGDDARWTLATPRRPRGLGRFVHELALAHALLQSKATQSGALCPSRVWFAHPRPSSLSALHAFFGTSDLAFGCADSGFALARTLLDRPIATADARTVEAIRPLVDSQLQQHPNAASLAHRVAIHVASALPRAADVREVARAMHMGGRTLQRQLEQEDTSFTRVLDEVRLERARQLLGDPALSVTDIAFRLGFADLATFSRAFKRWTGKPPGLWRRS